MSWSVSKSKRFQERKKGESSDFFCLPSTLNPRSTGIGFGQRWKPRNVCGMDSPPPGSYNLPDLSSTKGPVFAKSVLLTEKIRHITPGPGTYEQAKPFSRFSPKITLKSRIDRKISVRSPSPGAYCPSFTLTHNNEFSNISFGYGERSSIRKNLYDGPGPGTYEIPSKFDLKS